MIEIIVGFIVSFIIIKISLPFLVQFILDKPNIRSSHKKPTASGGGLVFLFSLFLLILKYKYYFLYPIITLSIVGFLDDIFTINRKYRLIIQSICSFLLLIFSPFFKVLIINSSLSFILLLFLCLLIGCSIINFFNFMDGIDGLIVGCSIPIFLTLNITYSTNIYIFIGSLLAFLLFNWYPAKLFMGDTGSTLLGALFAYFLFNADSYFEFYKLTLLASPIFLDSISCIFLRIHNGQNIFNAHKLHLYQRLVMGKLSSNTVSLIYIYATISLCFSYVYLNALLLTLNAFLILVLGLLLDKFYSKPFKDIEI